MNRDEIFKALAYHEDLLRSLPDGMTALVLVLPADRAALETANLADALAITESLTEVAADAIEKAVFSQVAALAEAT